MKTLTLQQLIDYLQSYAAAHPEHLGLPVFASYDGGYMVEIGRQMDLDDEDEGDAVLKLGGG